MRLSIKGGVAMVVKAVYEDGKLRPLEPIQLVEGQTVTIDVLPEPLNMSEAEAIRAALGDTVRWHDPNDDRHAWVEDMKDEIAEAFKGLKPLSDIIIEERNEQL
jgi:predicted DNA-binding antitoxin AbrB/MazE fold protein